MLPRAEFMGLKIDIDLRGFSKIRTRSSLMRIEAFVKGRDDPRLPSR